VTLLFILPVVACLVLWHYFWAGRRAAWASVTCALTGHDLAKKIAPNHEITVVRRPVPWPEKSRTLALTLDQLEARDAASLGIIAQQAGLRLVMDERPDLGKRRRGTLRFGAVAPAFALVIATMGTLVGRIPFGWAILAVAAVTGFAAVMNILSLAIELQAAARVRKILSDTRLFPRLAEEEAVAEAATGAAWRSVVPAGIAWCLPKASL
jgi:hypothetical protein